MEPLADRGMDIALPDASAPVPLPTGWTAGDPATGVPIVVGPEGDLRIAFVVAQNDRDPAAITAGAWRLVDDGFDLPIRGQAEAAPGGGWGATHQFAYGAPDAEGRSALAIVRVLGERAYVNLVWGTKAGLSRRSAQLGELLTAWRPDGLTEVDLSAREPAAWTAHESALLANFTRAAMRELQIPGAAIALVQNGAIVYAEGFGVTSATDPQPVTADTRFMIGSTTKSLTTLMMARLVEAGRFAWTTPVTDLLPGFALADAGVTAQVQMRHTVGAGTGMPRRDTDLMFRMDGVTAEHRMAEMREMTPTTGFGETFQYSNYLVAAGGYAAARAYVPDGTLENAYGSAMRELVFEPLGMTRSTTTAAAAHARDAAPHALDFAGNVAVLDPRIERFVDGVAPAGAAWSTAGDMARYLIHELGRDASDARRRPQTRIDGTSSYGLGLFLTREHGISVIEHGGNTLGFTSDMFFLPVNGFGVVVLTNMGGTHGGIYGANAFRIAVRQRIFELVLGAPAVSEQTLASATRSMHFALESRHQRVKTDADAVSRLEKWVGDYRCKELGPARIRRSGSGYRADFESWSSELGVETQPDGACIIVVTGPPWTGSLRLQAAEDGSELILDAWQTKYVFRR